MPIGTPNPDTGLIYYSEWMAATYSRVYSRSAELVKIDQALKAIEDQAPKMESLLGWYTDLASARRGDSAWIALELDQKIRDLGLVRVKRAFDDFTAAKGNSNWRASNRNGEGALTTLSNQILHMQSKLPPSEMAAVHHIEQERNKSIPALFKDCQVMTYSDRLTSLSERKTAVSTAMNLRTVYEDANKNGMGAPTTSQAEALLRSIGSEVDKWVRDAFFGSGHEGGGHSLIDDLPIKAIVESAMTEIKADLAAIVPIAGLTVSSMSTVYHTVNLVMQSIVADDLLDLERHLEGSDSGAAVASLREWQLAAVAKTTSSLLRAGTNVAAHATTIASCGFGVVTQLAISIANAILALAVVIGEMGMQYRQKKKLEAYLHNPTLGRDIFAQSYLAAAYYLLNTPDSHIALQLVRIGAPGWQADVDRMKKSGELRTIMETSAKVISQSKYRIRKSDTSKFREVVEITKVSKIKDSLRGQRTLAS